MTLESIFVAVVVAAFGAAGAVAFLKGAADGLWPARTVRLTWVWRPLAVVAGGLLAWWAEQDVEHLAIGLGAGTCTTIVAAFVRLRAVTPAESAVIDAVRPPDPTGELKP